MKLRARHRRTVLLAVGIPVVVLVVLIRLVTLTPPDLQPRAALPSALRVPGSSPTPGWPAAGQAALDVPGIGWLGSAGGQAPRPTASLAKVMTAYLTLAKYPLSATGGGFTLTVTPAEVRVELEDARQGDSVVPVRAGERLDERQLLEALLIRSGDNIARMLAEYEAGSVAQFVREMNDAARALGMHQTTYTDPSGLDPATISDARDQVRVFERAMRYPVFRQIVSMPSVTLPVTGTVDNYDPLISEGYEGKTGSDGQAAGCLAFFKYLTVAGRRLTVVGVVLGQGTGDLTSVLLGAAAAAAQRLVTSVAPAIQARTVLPAHTAAMVVTNAAGRRVSAGTAAPLRVIAWGGLRERLMLRPRTLGTDLRAGERVGEAALAGGLPAPQDGRSRTAVRASAPLPAPGLLWRLEHLL